MPVLANKKFISAWPQKLLVLKDLNSTIFELFLNLNTVPVVSMTSEVQLKTYELES